jgi:tetratricopeptide (TPR) repeat protein
VFALVDQLTEQILAGLDLSAESADRGVAELTSESLESYRLYTEGRNAARNVRRSDALKLFSQAVEIDPSFTMAYFYLWQGSRDISSQEEFRRKTLAGLDRLSERERLRVESEAAEWEGDGERALRLQEELVARYPDEAGAYSRLSVLYRSVLGDSEKAMRVLERGVRAVPTDGPLRFAFAYQLLYSGRFDEGLRELEAYARILPEEPNSHDCFGDAHMMMGRPEEAIARYNDALDVDGTFSGSYVGRAWAHAVLGRYDEALADMEAAEDVAARDELFRYGTVMTRIQLLARMGRYREADLVALEIQRWAEEANAPDVQNGARLLSSLLALDRSDFSKAIDSATRVLEALERLRAELRSEDVRATALIAHVAAGIAEARAGRLAEAQVHENEASALSVAWVPSSNWLYRSLEGEIALASGSLARAEEAFAAGLPDGKMSFGRRTPDAFFLNNSPSRDWRARIHKARGNVVGAIAEYRHLLTPSAEHKFVGVLEPRYVLELARLLDEAGDETAAREEYRRFLDLWKNADPDLPELAEARARLKP